MQNNETIWNFDNPLDRMPKESLRSNRALRDYWNMGEGRSLRKLLERYNADADKDPTDRQPTTKWNTISAWSKRFEWQARVARLTELRNQQEAIEQEEEWRRFREELREKERELSRLLIKKAEDMLKFPLATVSGEENGTTTIINPAGWRLRDVARLLDTASKIGRLSAEMATERLQVERMSDEELLRFIEAETGKPGAGHPGSQTPGTGDTG